MESRAAEERKAAAASATGAPETREPPPMEEPESRLMAGGRRRMVIYAVTVLVILAALYLGLPQIAGLSDTLDVLADADPWWIAVAFGLNVLSYVAYVALFRGVIGGYSGAAEVSPRLDWKASYQITMAGLAATRLFSAGGAGGIALTYWALRRAGMARRDSAHRMLAFLVLLYGIYMTTLIVCGILLRVGVFPGPNPVGMTIVPAAIAGVLVGMFLLVSLIPQDVERRLAGWSRGYRRRALWLRRLAAGPAMLASGTRTAIQIVRNPARGALALAGAAGFWAANIAVLWACFHAFGQDVSKAVLVQGFFVGMAANLLPFFPGGVGSVDAGMIGAFLAFGLPDATVIVSVLAYRVIAFWLPIPPGVIAYFQLRRTVNRWRLEGLQEAGPAGGAA